MQGHRVAGRQRMRHRATSQFVAECDQRASHLEDPRPLGVGHRSEVADNGPQQTELDAGRHDRDLVQDVLGLTAQLGHPTQYSVHHGRGNEEIGRGQHLGDVERVAGGEAVELRPVDPGRCGQQLDRRLAQRLERQAGWCRHRSARRAAGAAGDPGP